MNRSSIVLKHHLSSRRNFGIKRPARKTLIYDPKILLANYKPLRPASSEKIVNALVRLGVG